MFVGDMEHIANMKPVVNNPKHICTTYGRTANKSDNLCSPTII
jgi:hypothetical protein